MESFKNFYNVEKEITLESKVENDRLFVFYNNQWAQLSQEKNPTKFYSSHIIRHRYGTKICRELGISITVRKYSREYYLKYREAYCKASKNCSEKYSYDLAVHAVQY